MAVNLNFDDEETLLAWAEGTIDETDDQYNISVEEAKNKAHKRRKRILPPPILTPTQRKFEILDSKDKARGFDLVQFQETLETIASDHKKDELNETDKNFKIYWNKAVRGMLTIKKLGHQSKELIFLDNFLKLFWNDSFNPKCYIRK
jgi:hypothetical protein